MDYWTLIDLHFNLDADLYNINLKCFVTTKDKHNLTVNAGFIPEIQASCWFTGTLGIRKHNLLR